MNYPLISIIVPVYNVEKYLIECLESLLSQKYPNIEIVLVDDGSTDHSGNICDEYERRYSNIKCIHKKNAGLGFARNTGIEEISGKYVTFVDSDDWVSEELINNLFQGLSKNQVDFCKEGFKRVKNDGSIVSITKYIDMTYPGGDAAKELLPKMIGSSPDKHDSIEMCVCGVLYDASIIKEHNIRFPSERELISEDLVFNIDYMQCADGACTINSLDYYYRMNEVSLSHTYRKDRLEASAFFYKTIKKKLMDLGYGTDTILRLKRMFFIFIRMSISQESRMVSQNDRNTSLKNIYNICSNDVVLEAIRDYPVYRLKFKQRVFLYFIQNRNVNVLYFLANVGLL